MKEDDYVFVNENDNNNDIDYFSDIESDFNIISKFSNKISDEIKPIYSYCEISFMPSYNSIKNFKKDSKDSIVNISKKQSKRKKIKN